MPRLVMKFGGTSVANLERIRNAAEKVRREVERGYDVAVVVSAMAGKTNELVDLVRQTSALYDARRASGWSRRRSSCARARVSSVDAASAPERPCASASSARRSTCIRRRTGKRPPASLPPWRARTPDIV